jgi:hypothetical protein
LTKIFLATGGGGGGGGESPKIIFRKNFLSPELRVNLKKLSIKSQDLLLLEVGRSASVTFFLQCPPRNWEPATGLFWTSFWRSVLHGITVLTNYSMYVISQPAHMCQFGYCMYLRVEFWIECALTSMVGEFESTESDLGKMMQEPSKASSDLSIFTKK